MCTVNIESVYAFLDEGYTRTKLKDIQNAINFNDHPAVLKIAQCWGNTWDEIEEDFVNYTGQKCFKILSCIRTD